MKVACRYFALHAIADVAHVKVWREQLQRLSDENRTIAAQVLASAELAARALWNALDGIESMRHTRSQRSKLSSTKVAVAGDSDCRPTSACSSPFFSGFVLRDETSKRAADHINTHLVEKFVPLPIQNLFVSFSGFFVLNFTSVSAANGEKTRVIFFAGLNQRGIVRSAFPPAVSWPAHGADRAQSGALH
jgi:hypothetical protein